MTDTTDNLALRAARTRSHLSELVESLQHQITPGELVHKLVGYGGTSDGIGLANSIGAQVSRNPLACLMIAAGVGWLIYSETADRARTPKRRRTSSRSRRKRPARRKKAP